MNDYFPLKMEGKNLKALCPFHKEKTPSFKVDAERGSYYCFGCQERGDVFSFVMKMEGLSFREALERLAERAGIALETGSGPSNRPRKSRDGYTLLKRASDWYQGHLWGEAGAGARNYLESRAIEAETSRQFGLGYALSGWGALRDQLLSGAEDIEGARAVGLLRSSEAGRDYDAFRGRLMFPIRDTLGRVVGFGARVLEGEDGPKYINSPESPYFKKGALLYGLYEGRDEIKAHDTLVVMEGYTDVLLSHQHGFRNAVATLGTALTETNLQLIARYGSRVTFVFDGDRAGRQAALKATKLGLQTELELSVVLLPDGRDPGDILKSAAGAEELRALLAAPQSAFDFVLDELERRHEDLIGPVRSTHICRDFFGYIEEVDSAVRRQAELGQLAQRLELPRSAVDEEFEKHRRSRTNRRSSSIKLLSSHSEGKGHGSGGGAASTPNQAPKSTPADSNVGVARLTDRDILIGALLDAESAPLLLALYPASQFANQQFEAIAKALASGKRSSAGFEDLNTKSLYLELEEEASERGLCESARHRLLFDLIVYRIRQSQKALRQLFEHKSALISTKEHTLWSRCFMLRTELQGALVKIRSNPRMEWDALGLEAERQLALAEEIEEELTPSILSENFAPIDLDFRKSAQ